MNIHKSSVFKLFRKTISSLLTFCIVSVGFVDIVLSQQENQPNIPLIVNKAKIKAAKDAEEKSRTGWIVGSTLASLVLSPLLGGLGSVAIAYNTGGETSIPTSDMMQLQSEYGDDFNVNMIYAETYQNEYKRIIRKRNGGGAWIGTGIGFAVNMVLILAILNENESSY